MSDLLVLLSKAKKRFVSLPSYNGDAQMGHFAGRSGTFCGRYQDILRVIEDTKYFLSQDNKRVKIRAT